MTQNTTGSLADNSPISCNDSLITWNQSMDKMYTYFYLLLFIPALLLNTIAVWVLCRHISKKTKAVIFMINLALADLAHTLSLPLRIYYYFTHTWPFGRSICMFCFYLKYLNMYAAIMFLMCISVQRCAFLLDPFVARRWRRRYDLLISVIVWVVVGLACSPFILMRISSNSALTATNISHSLDITFTPQPLDPTKPFMQQPLHTTVSPPMATSSEGCFKDLPYRKVRFSVAVTMMTLAELFGFLIPLICISYSSIRIAWSLKRSQSPEQQNSTTLGSSTHSRLQSVTSNGQPDQYSDSRANSEKQRGLRMVLSCCALFLFCFAPYHINFLLFLMVSQNYVSHCATRLAVKQFHPVSLCMASLSCCLNPLLYYFLTAEFRRHLGKRTSSFSSSLFSSPISSPTDCPTRTTLLRIGSSCSERE
ncbi:putative P2Y purinoceptor 10 isoform 1-T2 [Odontesthes bonariensis]|uniref:putative P2Y purinoceptor 10 n=1 Tax=Odontesthes bonariensis TaxID=219752 RepID=UPI003F581ADF